MNEELKENMCNVDFRCEDSTSKKCAYKKIHGDPPTRCLFLGLDSHYECASSVARVNAMVNECKRLGFVAVDEVQKNILNEIKALLKQSIDSGTGLNPVEEAVKLIDGVLKEGRCISTTQNVGPQAIQVMISKK